MKTQRIAIILITFSLLFAGARAEDKQSSKPSDVRSAEAVLSITTDPQVLPMGDTEETAYLNLFLDSPEVFGNSFPAGFGDRVENLAIQPVEPPKLIGGSQIVRIKISFSVKETDLPLAGKFVQTYIDHLKAKLKAQYASGMDIFLSRLQVFTEEVDLAEARLAELQARQNKVADGMPMDKQSVLQRQMENRRAVTENELQQRIFENRMKEISEQIAEIHDEIQVKIANDEVLRQLQDLLAQQENEFKIIEQANETGGLAQSEVARFREKLIRTKIEWAQRKEQLRDEGSTISLRELNRQLQETTMHLQELETQQQVLMGTDPGSLSRGSDYEILEVKINAAKENLHNTIMEKTAYEHQMKLIQPPTVRVEYISDIIKPSETD